MGLAASQRGLATGAVLLALCAGGPAAAEDLRGALVSTYQTNPDLQAARAGQRAVDENVVIEKAGGRPGANGSATYTEFVHDSTDSPTAPDRQLSASVSVGMPVYSGGGVKYGIRAAETRVTAGQADLRATEAAIFTQAVTAYMDVILGEAVVRLNRNNVDVLNVNLQATSDRFQIGDLTRTDVAQSQSRLALARSDARISEANLANAREHYIAVVGKTPVALEPPPPLPNLPASAEEAVAIALDANPDLIAARERSKAAGYDVRVAGSARLPTLEVFTGGSYVDYFGTMGGAGSAAIAQSSTAATAGLRASIPIFQGGRPAALRRQAQARAGAALESEIGAERDVIALTRSAWSSWQAANEVIASNQVAVDAATLSLEGVRAENSVGNRTILDILDAERELVQTQVRLVTARRNAYVAGFTLLAAMGKAEAQDLGLDGGALYDPQVNYDRVRGKWSDWENDPAPVAKATRTVDTPAQDGSIPAER